MESPMRARAAIMDGLKNVAQGAAAANEDALERAWLENRLPTAADDPRLWRDARAAYGRGLKLISDTRQVGGQFMEPVAIVADLPVTLPWGFVTKPGYASHFQPIRFARTSVSDVEKHLRPLLVGLPMPGTKTLTVHYVLSDKTDSVKPSGALEKTDAFKAAVRLIKGDLRPTRGPHCARCAFQSICPSTPGR